MRAADDAIGDLLARVGAEGPRRFSGWDAARFEAHALALLEEAARRIPGAPARTLQGLAELVRQGVGEGYLAGEPGDAPRNVLEAFLRDWLPGALAELPEPEHLPLMARAWNLGEGLLGEAEWVDGYVLSRIGELHRHDRPEGFLMDVLRPLLEPAPPARWEPPYRVTTLALRPADDAFLPGEMGLAAPTVLVVADRRRPVRLGVHLRRGGRTAILGHFGPSTGFADGPVDLDVAWEGGTARIGSEAVALPTLGRPYHWALVRAGFLVASAPDSQKLWVVEAAS